MTFDLWRKPKSQNYRVGKLKLLIMKKQQLLFYLAFIMSIMTLQAQNSFCEQFNQNATTGLQYPGCTGTAVNNVLDNWGTINAGLKYQNTGSQNGAGDNFLILDDGSCGNGGSWAYNSTDYSGNWMQMVQDDGCFCYDFKSFHVQVGTQNGNSLRIYNGSDPLNTTLIATFVLSIPLDTSLGWVRICAPIGLSDSSGNLPSNSDGQWVINTSSSLDWDNLITNVKGIGYYIDVGSGNEIYGVDNICISEDCDSTLVVNEPTNEGSYCCEGENLVKNGNFEFGDTDFKSEYNQTTATYPGEYDVVTSASNFNASITDHSFCEDSTLYANNENFMVVNGRTQQPTGTTSVIWEQTISVKPEKNYKLCANFKNMPQCTFDIFPEIQIEINGALYPWTKIDTDATNPCDWQQISECFTGNGEELVVKIHLKEDGNGDGNDLAIDDISIQEKLNQELSLTVQNQGYPQQTTASINSISNTDDVLLVGEQCLEQTNGNQYYWFVYELTSFPFNPPIDNSNMAPNSWSWSSNLGGFSSQGLPASSTNPAWSLTTNFQNYNFENNKLYVIGMYVPSCCESCYDEAWAYQLTLNGAKTSGTNGDTIFTKEARDYLRSMFREFNQDNTESIDETGVLSVYPNPSNNVINIKSKQAIKSYTIFDMLGKKVIENVTDKKQINVSSLQSNMYFINIETEDGNIQSLKFIKQ